MAISKLVKSGQSFDRPSVSAFFGKAGPANDNLQKKSDMFAGDGNFVTSITNMLQELNGQLQKLQETSQKTILAFNKIIKDIRDVKKDIVSKFRIVNNELSSNKLDFVSAIRNKELPKPIEMPDPGTPVPANAPAAPAAAPTTQGPDIWDLLSGAGIGKDLVKGLIRFAASPVGAVLLAGTATFAAFAAAMFSVAGLADKFENWLGLKEKYKARMETQEYKDMQDTQTKITEDARKTNVDKGDRIKMMQKTLDDNKLQKKDVKTLQGDILTTIDGRQFDIKTQKPVEATPDTTTAAPTATPAASTPSAPTDNTQTPAAAPAATAPTPGGVAEDKKTPETPASAGGSGSGEGAPSASAPASTPTAPAAASMPSTPAASSAEGGTAGSPTPVVSQGPEYDAMGNVTAPGAPEQTKANTIVKGQEPVYTAMGDLAIPGTPDQAFVGSGRGSVVEGLNDRANAQAVGSGRGSVIEKPGERTAASAPKPKAVPTAAPAVDPHSKSKAMFQQVLDMERSGDSGATAMYFAADKQRQAELAAIKDTPATGAPAKKAEPNKQKEMSAMDKMRMGRGAGDHTAPMGLGDESAGYTGAAGDILQAGLNQQAALNAGPEPGYGGKAGAVLQTNLNDMAVVEAEQQKERAAAAQKMQAIDDADMARAPGERAVMAADQAKMEAIKSGITPAKAGARTLRQAGAQIGPKPADLEPPPKMSEQGGTEPIVQNNNQTQNSGTSSGGSGNNVAGQNLPMKATNDWLNDFIWRQQIIYQ